MPQTLRPPADRQSDSAPPRGLWGRLALGGAAAAVIAVPFTLLMLLVLSEWEPLEDLDRGVADRLNDVALADPTLVSVLRFGAHALSPWVFRLAVLGVAVWLWRRGTRRLAAWAVVTAAVGGVLGIVLKLVVARARPAFPEPVASAGGYSFPSGHALNSMLCVGILLVVLIPVLGRKGRATAYVVGGALVLLTGYDRVALGVHYVSDVLAGWVVALAVLAGTSAAFEVWRREQKVSRAVGFRSMDAGRVARVAGRVVLSLAVLYGLLVGIGLLLTRVLDDSAVSRAEDDLNQSLADGRTATMDDVTYVLSGLGNTAAVVGALVVVAAGLWFATRKWTLSLFLVLAVSAQALVFLLVGLTISRQRPDVERLDSSPPTSSFPSGHTGAATALFLGSALLVGWYVRNRAVKIVALTVLVAVPLLVAYARLYRGMHHPSDILGAYVNASACIAIAAGSVLGLGWRRGEHQQDPPSALASARATR